MSAACLPYEIHANARENPHANRVAGGVSARFIKRQDTTVLFDLKESDGYKLRLPRVYDAPCEGIIINTGGGVAAGDHVSHAIEVEAGSAATLSSQAAERIYRSDSKAATAHIHVTLKLGPDAFLAWLPQETILYDNARLARRFKVDMLSTSRLLALEILVFGRKAMGEQIMTGAWQESWRIRRDGRLVFAENTRLEGPIHDALQRPAITNGATVSALAVYIAPHAEARLEAVRTALASSTTQIAASAWNGLLCIRCLGASLEAVRRDLTAAIAPLYGRSMPRVWST